MTFERGSRKLEGSNQRFECRSPRCVFVLILDQQVVKLRCIIGVEMVFEKESDVGPQRITVSLEGAWKHLAEVVHVRATRARPPQHLDCSCQLAALHSPPMEP